MLRALLFGILLLGVAGIGGAAWIATRPPAEQRAKVEAPKPKVQVLGAARALRAGALLKPEDLQPVTFDAGGEPAGARPDTRAARQELFGAMIRRSLLPGEVILPDDVLRPGDRGFLAAVLAPDKRAVTIGVDAVTGQAGLIWPGDRVDVLLTQQLSEDNLPPSQRIAGETVLSDVRVIAIDQSLVQGGAGDGDGGRVNRTVTLEVSQREAERMAVAARLGRLSLSVRSAMSSAGGAADAAPPGAPQITWGGDVSPALRGGPRATDSPPATVRVFQGTRSEEFRF